MQAAVDHIIAEGEIKAFAEVEVDGSNAAADETIIVGEHHKRKHVDEESPLKKQEVTTDIPTLAANGHRSGEGDVPEGSSVDDSGICFWIFRNVSGYLMVLIFVFISFTR